jgi:hypothetical protein
MNNIIKEINVFYDECNGFLKELDSIINIEELMVLNIKEILNKNDFTSLLNIIKQPNDILEFLQIIKNINIINTMFNLFVESISIDIYKYKNLTDTTKFNFNTKQYEIRKLAKTYFKHNKQEIEQFTNDYINSITMLNDDTLQKINDLYNDSFIIMDKSKYKNIVFNIAQHVIKNEDQSIKIYNLIINEIVVIYNKFIDSNKIIEQFNEINKNNVLNLNNGKQLSNISTKFKNNSNSDTFKIKKTNFQLFNFIPFLLKNKNDVMSIQQIISKLLNYNMKSDNILLELSNAAKCYSVTKHINFTIILIQNNGNSINYNINPLFDKNVIISNSAGVNLDMIYKYNTIEQMGKSIDQEFEYIHVINYSNDAKNIGILLETHDFKHFRIMINTNVINPFNKNIENVLHSDLQSTIFINDDIITKILKQDTSDRIANYNKNVESSILENVTDNSLSQFYTSVDSNFNIYTSDTIYEKFTNHITESIISNILIILKNKNIKKSEPTKSVKNKILSILLNNGNIDIFTNSIIEFYNTMKLTTGESYLTYLSLLEYTINKFKKELIDNYNTLPYDTKTNNAPIFDTIYNLVIVSVKNVINIKTHIYDMSIEKEQLLIAFKHKLNESL